LAFRCRPVFLIEFWSPLLLFNFTKNYLRTIKVDLWWLPCMSVSVWFSFHKLTHNVLQICDVADLIALSFILQTMFIRSRMFH
jgi:hypothetical protein